MPCGSSMIGCVQGIVFSALDDSRPGRLKPDVTISIRLNGSFIWDTSAASLHKTANYFNWQTSTAGDLVYGGQSAEMDSSPPSFMTIQRLVMQVRIVSALV